MSCVCGSTTHRRITHTDCRFNQSFVNNLNTAFVSSPTTFACYKISTLSLNMTPTKRKAPISLTNVSKKLNFSTNLVILKFYSNGLWNANKFKYFV